MQQQSNSIIMLLKTDDFVVDISVYASVWKANRL
jgi:hypothetical protein